MSVFAKPRRAFEPAAPKGDGGPLDRVLAIVKNPLVPPIGAAVLFAGAAAILLAVAADPTAGAPSARVALKREAAAQAAPAAAPNGMEAFTLDSLGLFQDLTAPGFELQDAPPVQGAAVITLPDSEPVPGQGGAVRRPPADPLPPAPIAGVVQPSPLGPMPTISPDGRTPAQAYARPFRDPGGPKVALVVGGLGLNPAATRAAIERLPAEVTLSFVPYAEGLQGWIDLARADGHEVLLEIPMEPTDYPDNDPGPYTLLSTGASAETVRRMEWLMSRATGYYGVTNYLGSKFLSSDSGVSTFMDVLRSRGLAFVDDGQARGRRGAWSRASADRVVDEDMNAQAIVAQLNALEQTAKTRGAALGSGFAYPVTVEAAARWTEGLKARGVTLAPASAMTRR